jgi:hypothetical protein
MNLRIYGWGSRCSLALDLKLLEILGINFDLPAPDFGVVPDRKQMAKGFPGETRYVVRASRPTPVGFEEKSLLLKRRCKVLNAQLKRIGAKFKLVGIFS